MPAFACTRATATSSRQHTSGGALVPYALLRRRVEGGRDHDEVLRGVGQWGPDRNGSVDKALRRPLDSDLEEVSEAQAREFEEMAATGAFHPLGDAVIDAVIDAQAGAGVRLDDWEGVLMSGPGLSVLTSRWDRSELEYYPDADCWTWKDEANVGRLSEPEVLARYGDEAFRRREEMRRSGASQYQPAVSRLVGRRVVNAIEQAGWRVDRDETDSQDGIFFVAAKGAARMALQVSGQDSRRLELLTGRGARHTTSVAEAERWMLTEALGAED